MRLELLLWRLHISGGARVVQYGYDDAGRMISLAAGATIYATRIQYASHGGMSRMTYGNTLIERWSYNAALQPLSITVGTSATVGDRLWLQYSYCGASTTADCAGNNGNMKYQVIDGGPTQSYGYDTVSRLERVDEAGGSQVWHQLFTIMDPDLWTAIRKF